MIKIDFLKRKKKFVKNNTQPDPNLYWIIIFNLGVILIILTLFFGFYFFVKINKEEVLFPLNENKQLEKISKKRINKILDIFNERREISNKIQNSSAPVVDPSL